MAPTTTRPRRRLNAAEAVADVVRDRILSGDVGDGNLLATQDDLSVEFGVSKAAIREACRILETEGLLSIQRGNIGGARVHLPTPTTVAYSLALVLNSRAVELADVRASLAEMEPVCAGLCAGRPDRAESVMPVLDAAHRLLVERLDAGDGSGAALAARAWHEALVQSCGLQTLAVVAGALEDVWSSHIRAGLPATNQRRLAPDPAMSRSVVADHALVNSLIAAGDVPATIAAAGRHLHDEPRIHADSAELTASPVRAETVRDQLFSRQGPDRHVDRLR